MTYGDLLDFRFRTDDALDSWLSQVDDFGTLVMAAASLPDGTNVLSKTQRTESGVRTAGTAQRVVA